MIILFTILFGFFTAAAGFLSSSGKLIDETKTGTDRLTAKGFIVGFFLLGTVLIPIFQVIYSNSLQHTKDDEARKEEQSRDSVLRKYYDSTEETTRLKYEVSTKDIIRGLSEYGLKYDSAQKRIEKLVIDSAKQTTVYGADPALSFCPEIPVKDDSLGPYPHLEYNICCTGAAAKIISLKAYIFIQNSGFGYEYLGAIDRTVAGTVIPPNSMLSNPLPFNTTHEPDQLKAIYILVKIKYSSIDGKRKFMYKEAVFRALGKKDFGGVDLYRYGMLLKAAASAKVQL